jgi:PST family polysaccharide transporter
MATAFSFELALIQKADPTREHYDTAWTLNVLLALVGAAVTAALAFPAASFYGDPRLVAVMFVIGAGWLISGFENPGIANFRRRMDFSAEFRWMSSKRVASFIVTLIAAFAFRSYWALVLGMVTGRIVGVVMSYVMEPFRPRFSVSRARDLFSFSGWMLGTNIASVAVSHMPHIYVGRVFQAQLLGAYTVGSEIAHLVHTELVAPINRAMFPGYARMVDEPETLRRVCIESTAAILLVVLPVSAAVAVLAEPMVRVLLGDQWHAAVGIIQVLSFAGAIAAVNANNISVYLALGKPYLSTFVLGTRAGVFLVVVAVFTAGTDVVMVAWAELAAALASLAVSLPVLFSSLRLRTVDYIVALWRPALASAVGAYAVHVAVSAVGPTDGFSVALLQMLVGLGVGSVVYPLALVLLWILAGRPESVETLLGQRIKSALAGILRRVRSGPA